MTGDEETAPHATGLILSGDVAALRREVAVLRRLVVRADAVQDRLQTALRAARLPHQATCPAYSDPSLPCGCRAGQHNAAIDAALEEKT